MKDIKTATISLRLPEKLKRDFYRKAAQEPNQDPSDVLRALIAAYLRKQPNLKASHDH